MSMTNVLEHRAALLAQCPPAPPRLPEAEAAKLPIHVTEWGTAGPEVLVGTAACRAAWAAGRARFPSRRRSCSGAGGCGSWTGRASAKARRAAWTTWSGRHVIVRSPNHFVQLVGAEEFNTVVDAFMREADQARPVPKATQ